MIISIKAATSKIVLALSLMTLMTTASAFSQLNIGVGHGPQVGKHVEVQNNSVFDISYTFYQKRFGFLWEEFCIVS